MLKTIGKMLCLKFFLFYYSILLIYYYSITNTITLYLQDVFILFFYLCKHIVHINIILYCHGNKPAEIWKKVSNIS